MALDHLSFSLEGREIDGASPWSLQAATPVLRTGMFYQHIHHLWLFKKQSLVPENKKTDVGMTEPVSSRWSQCLGWDSSWYRSISWHRSVQSRAPWGLSSLSPSWQVVANLPPSVEVSPKTVDPLPSPLHLSSLRAHLFAALLLSPGCKWLLNLFLYFACLSLYITGYLLHAVGRQSLLSKYVPPDCRIRWK